MNRKDGNEINDRLKIAEKALSNLADRLERHEAAVKDEIKDVQLELKALKLFLTRNIPSFKEQFPEIRRKVK